MLISFLPCGVSMPGATSHFGQTSLEYSSSLSFVHVGERTPCRVKTSANFSFSPAACPPVDCARQALIPKAAARERAAHACRCIFVRKNLRYSRFEIIIYFTAVL